jgi:predicted DNA-binding WGR domain protein
MKRYFERMIEYNRFSNRPEYSLFWEISVSESCTTERSGVSGTKGDSRTLTWQSAEEAIDRAEQMVFEKEQIGFQQKPVPPEIVDLPMKFPVKRYFADDSEFWEITIAGRSVAERFGTIGTPGDSKVSILSSPEEAMVWSVVLKEEKEAAEYLERPLPQEEPIEVLPKSLRTFLLAFNGGFIWRRKGSSIDLFEKHPNFINKTEIELKRRVSFPLFSAGEIGGSRWEGALTVCKAWNEEVLTVWYMHQPHQDSPVFDAFHESEIYEWNMLYPTFAHLFIEYVETEGLIHTGQDLGYSHLLKKKRR